MGREIMDNIDRLEPREVFKFFREICDIPHGSGNTKAISDYCVRFAKERNLRCSQDELGNVVIFKAESHTGHFEIILFIFAHLLKISEN